MSHLHAKKIDVGFYLILQITLVSWIFVPPTNVKNI